MILFLSLGSVAMFFFLPRPWTAEVAFDNESGQIWFDSNNDRHFSTKAKLLKDGFSLTTPVEWDWSQLASTPIKDQGKTMACWTIGATEAVEYAHWMAGNDMQKLSAQVLLDCVRPTCPFQSCKHGKYCLDGTCDWKSNDSIEGGGRAEDGFQWFQKHGYVSATNYPFRFGICKNIVVNDGSEDEAMMRLKCDTLDFCKWNHDAYLKSLNSPCESVTDRHGYCQAGQHDVAGHVGGTYLVSYHPDIKLDWSPSDAMVRENVMTDALYRMGPLAIAINADNLHAYEGGIISDERDPLQLNHVLLLVGYGSENGTDYWKIRNSWGPFFGERGYFRLKRGANVWGVASSVSAVWA